MGHLADYDTDILAWSEEQALMLRGLPRGLLPNGLDLENIVEEIESLGRSILSGVESHLRQMLTHVIKAASSPGVLAVRKWHAEIGQAQIEAAKDFAPSMRRRLDLDTIWRRASRQAALELAAYAETPIALPEACPFSLDELLDETLPPDTYPARLRRTD